LFFHDNAGKGGGSLFGIKQFFLTYREHPPAATFRIISFWTNLKYSYEGNLLYLFASGFCYSPAFPWRTADACSICSSFLKVLALTEKFITFTLSAAPNNNK